MSSPILEAFIQSDTLGKAIFISLTALSIVTWILGVYKVWMIKKLEQGAEHIERVFKQYRRAPINIDIKTLDQQTGWSNPFLSLYSILQQNTMELLKKNRELKAAEATFLSSTDIEQLAGQMDMKIYAERKEFERYLFILSTTFSLAPLLGLLGTVWGISMTFSQLPNSANVLSNNAVLAGLAMALGTTVFGIVVAIPALIFYNYLKSRIENYTVQMNRFSSEILNNVEVQYRAVDVD